MSPPALSAIVVSSTYSESSSGSAATNVAPVRAGDMGVLGSCGGRLGEDTASSSSSSVPTYSFSGDGVLAVYVQAFQSLYDLRRRFLSCPSLLPSAKGSYAGCSKRGPSDSRTRLRKAGEDHWGSGLDAGPDGFVGERGAGVGTAFTSSILAISAPLRRTVTATVCVYASSQSMLFPGVLTAPSCTNCAPCKLSTTSSPMPTPVVARALALVEEKRTRTWPLLRRSRKSGSASRRASWRCEDEYGHMSVTTALICFESSASRFGRSAAMRMCSILVQVRHVHLVSLAMCRTWLLRCDTPSSSCFRAMW